MGKSNYPTGMLWCLNEIMYIKCNACKLVINKWRLFLNLISGLTFELKSFISMYTLSSVSHLNSELRTQPCCTDRLQVLTKAYSLLERREGTLSFFEANWVCNPLPLFFRSRAKILFPVNSNAVSLKMSFPLLLLHAVLGFKSCLQEPCTYVGMCACIKERNH